MGDDFPDPLLIAASFTNLEFSYRTIPLRRIRFACRLIAGAKCGRIFRQEMIKPVTPEASQAKKDGAILLTKIDPLFIGGSDLPRLCVRCSMYKLCDVGGLACGSFSLMGMNDRHSQTLVAHPFRNDNHIRHL